MLRDSIKRFTDDPYERLHFSRNRNVHRCFALTVIVHWVYLVITTYIFSGSFDWALFAGIHLPVYCAFLVAAFVPWNWNGTTRTLWYLTLSLVGCVVPISVNIKTFICHKSALNVNECDVSIRPGNMNVLLYATIGPLIILTAFRNALLPQLLNNAAILVSFCLQVPYTPRSTWLNIALLIGAFTFFFSLRINQNVNEYAAHNTSVDLQSRLDEGIALRQKESEMSTSRELLTNFIFHEIRVPLNTVVLSVDLLESTFSLKKHLSEDEEETFDQVKTGLGAVQNVVNDALDIGRLEQGRLHVDKQPFKLFKFITNLIRVLRFSWERKNINLVLNMQPNPSLTILGDQTRLRQIISNLVSNAVKFTPSGGMISINVSVKLADETSGTLSVSVVDTGIGISKNDQSVLFKPFVQIDPNRNQQGLGSGLGLSICAHLVKLQGGDIGVTSEIDRGSEFWFTLPFQKWDGNYETHTIISKHPSSQDMPTLRVLVTDDDYGTRAVLFKILSNRLGHTVHLAVDGVDCLEKVEQASKAGASYDILFLDNRMPRMDGIEAISHLRRNGFNKPIVCLTGSTSPYEEARLRTCGATTVLTKPCKIVDIERTLSEVTQL